MVTLHKFVLLKERYSLIHFVPGDLPPSLMSSLHLAFHKSINGRACHLFHWATLGNKLIIYQPIACPIALIKLEYK